MDFTVATHSLDMRESVPNTSLAKERYGTAWGKQLSYSWPERPKKPELRRGELKNSGKDTAHRRFYDININYVSN